MKIIDGNREVKELNIPIQKELPHAGSSMVIGIISICACLVYGSGIVLAFIARKQIKTDLLIYNSSPETYQRSYKKIKVAQITSTCGLWGGIGFTILLVITAILES